MEFNVLWVFAAILWWCSKLNATNNPVEMSLNGIVINSELVNLPKKLCCVWAATRDSKQRKLNYSIDYRYGINLKIVPKTSHVFLLILLAGDVAINPGPTTTLPRTSATARPSVLIMLLISIACSVSISMQGLNLELKTANSCLEITLPSIVATGLGEQEVEHC